MTPRLHNCENAALLGGGVASLWPFFGRGARSAFAKAKSACPQGGARRPAEPFPIKPHQPSVRIGGRMRCRFVFSHARHSSFRAESVKVRATGVGESVLVKEMSMTWRPNELGYRTVGQEERIRE